MLQQNKYYTDDKQNLLKVKKRNIMKCYSEIIA